MGLLFSIINKCNLEIENKLNGSEVLFSLTAHSTKFTKEQGKCFSFPHQGLTLISTAGNWIILEFIFSKN